MAVAVDQARGEVDQVEQRCRLVVEVRRGASDGPGPAGSRTPGGSSRRADQLDPGAADSGGLVSGRMKSLEFGRCQEVFALDANCSRTQRITSSIPSFCRRLTSQERPLAPHLQAVPAHDLQVGPDVWGQIGLVDDQQVAVADARPSLAGNLVALRPRR